MYGYFALVTQRPKTGYCVEFPDLPGCRGSAASVEDALAMAQRTLGTYAAALYRQRLDLPAPRPVTALAKVADQHGALAAACLRTPPVESRGARRKAPDAPAARIIPLKARARQIRMRAAARL